MKKLSYGVLSFLSVKPSTGYELNQQLNRLWHTNHSAIYPILSELQEYAFVICEKIEQTNKPDKKIYHITLKGLEELKSWIAQESGFAVFKSEWTFKVYCLQILDKQLSNELLDKLEEHYKIRFESASKNMEQLHHICGDKFENRNSPNLGMYILLHRGIDIADSGLRWCRWIRSLINQTEIPFLEKPPF